MKIRKHTYEKHEWKRKSQENFYFELIEKENTTYQNLGDPRKAKPGGFAWVHVLEKYPKSVI